MSSKNPNGVSLSDSYPANSILELTLSPNGEVVKGLVYCTDEISNSIVIKKSLEYTTLASEYRIINASTMSPGDYLIIGIYCIPCTQASYKDIFNSTLKR